MRYPCIGSQSMSKPTNPMKEISLREFYAGLAMIRADFKFYVGVTQTTESLKTEARRCVQIADAMIEALESKDKDKTAGRTSSWF